jgi:hypothetical protein
LWLILWLILRLALRLTLGKGEIGAKAGEA